jgi:hypothetical protein
MHARLSGSRRAGTRDRRGLQVLSPLPQPPGGLGFGQAGTGVEGPPIADRVFQVGEEPVLPHYPLTREIRFRAFFHALPEIGSG